MRHRAIKLTAAFICAMAMSVVSVPTGIRAQTQNQTTRIEFTEAFIFPNDCTGEIMDVSDTTVVTCHDQLRADGSFGEKCQIRQDVTAVGQTTGITFHGSGTFKDEFRTTDACNFSFTNVGRVNLISPGSDVNLVLNFDELVTMENCAMTADSHVVSADCRGSRP